MRELIILFSFLLFCKCSDNEGNQKTKNSIQQLQNPKIYVFKNDTSKQISIKQKASKIDKDISHFIEDTNTIDLKSDTYKENTNFDNYKESKYLSKKIIAFLKLQSIIKNHFELWSKHVWIHKRILLSENFYTLVICYYNSGNELFTILINYDFSYNIIGYKEIAYDEIAESCIRIESLIKKNSLTILKTDFCYKLRTDTIHYFINDDGKIKN